MRTAQALTLVVALAGTAVLSVPARAVEVCDKSCVGPLCAKDGVGPLCAKDCVREPNATVGRGERDKVIIEERSRRTEPDVVIKERERRPNVDIEVGR
jgi:hypothetical protein